MSNSNPNHYIICIPSYKRSKLCNEKTLTTLHNNHINNSRIYVYVANEDEYLLYKQELNKDFYGKIIVGVKGLVKQREFIMSCWGEHKHIVFMDDDISHIDLLLSPTFKNHNLDYFIKYAFSECNKHNSFIWGVYAVYNPFFREQRSEISYILNFIVGAFYGIINRPNKKEIKLTQTVKTSQKEDVERSIKYFIEDDVVVRFNRVGFITKYYNNDGGGCGNFNQRILSNKKAAIQLNKKYSKYGHLKTRKNGMTEFVLNKTQNKTHNKTHKKTQKTQK
jgi:hypothetical protein